MRLGRTLSALACLLALAGPLAGCGSGGSDMTASSGAVAENAPAPPKSEFPATEGRSLGEVLEAAKPSQLVISPAAAVFNKGKNRFPFGVFEKDRTQVGDAKVALYFAKVPTLHPKNGKLKKGAKAQARLRALEEPAVGPFPA
jgi:hypothetical protein